ncbi:hypothetical protein MRS76_13395 [Rhizobiaceae bacterium n13]|uniref:hypothetical protein n=1 Tax=Ferirhizobium litorale TaxID=2927786 RepID=UPI0024B2FE9C|nr:hypothetical protein [Fererhizobium litorale]MDI7862953.1 hypothetical protein [Fererhizobium litorale]
MKKPEKPSTHASRVSDIKAVGTALDNQQTTEILFDTQAEWLTTYNLMARAGISIWHAKSVMDALNLGGR